MTWEMVFKAVVLTGGCCFGVFVSLAAASVIGDYLKVQFFGERY
jgi:hypothetical protein